MIVPDASVIVEILLRTPDAEYLETLLFKHGETLHAPHLLDIEVAQVLRRYVLSGEAPSERCREAISDLADFPLYRYPHGFLLSRVWEIRNNLTAYDAVYVALAEALGARLLTRDARIAGAPGHSAQVVLV